jgi:hypothetical protein
MLEALYALLDDPKTASVRHTGEAGRDIVTIKLEGGLLLTINLFMDITATFQISLFGQKGWRLIEIKNSYSMFKENLTEFIRSVRKGKSRLDFNKTENIIRTLIAAKESLESGGKTIDLI